MTGRRLVSWFDEHGAPQVTRQELWDGSASETFEDDLLDRMDYERNLRRLVALLSAPERELLRRLLSGERPARADKDVLYRLRRKLAATDWLKNLLSSRGGSF